MEFQPWPFPVLRSLPPVQSPASRTLQSPGNRTPARGGSVTLAARTQVLPESVPTFAYAFARTPVCSSRSRSPSLTRTYIVSKSVPDSQRARMRKMISPGYPGSLSVPISPSSGSSSVPPTNSPRTAHRGSPGPHRATSEIPCSSLREPLGRQRSKETDLGPTRATSDTQVKSLRLPLGRQRSKETDAGPTRATSDTQARSLILPVGGQRSKGTDPGLHKPTSDTPARSLTIPVAGRQTEEAVCVASATPPPPFVLTPNLMSPEKSPSSSSRPGRGRATVWTPGPPSSVAPPGSWQQAGLSNGRAANPSVVSSPRTPQASDPPKLQSWLLLAQQGMEVNDPNELPPKAPTLRPYTMKLPNDSPLNKLWPREDTGAARGRSAPAEPGEQLPVDARTSFAWKPATQCNGEVATGVAEDHPLLDSAAMHAQRAAPDFPPEHVDRLDSWKRALQLPSSIFGNKTSQWCSESSDASTEVKIESAGDPCCSDTAACMRTEAKVMDAGNQCCAEPPPSCTCAEVKILDAGDLNRALTTEQTTGKASIECGVDASAQEPPRTGDNYSIAIVEAASAFKSMLMAQETAKPKMDIVCTSIDAHKKIGSSCNSNDSSREATHTPQLDLRRLGFYTVEVAQSSGELGLLLHAQGKLQEAESLLRQALLIHERTLGPKHPSIAADCSKLGHLLHDRGQLQEAATFFQRSLEVGEGSLEASHQEITLRCSNLELLLDVQDERGRAEPLPGHDVATWQQTSEVLNACNSFGQQVLRALRPAGDTLSRTAVEAKESFGHELMSASTEVAVSPLPATELHPTVETTMVDTSLLKAESAEAPPLDLGDVDNSSAVKCVPQAMVPDRCTNIGNSASIGNGSVHTSPDPQERDAYKLSAPECIPQETVPDHCANTANSASLAVNGNGSVHTSPVQQEGGAGILATAECVPQETVPDRCANTANIANIASFMVDENGSFHTSLDPQDPGQRARAALQHAIHRLSLFTVELAQNSDSSSLLHLEGKLEEAEAFFRQALVICEQALDSEYQNTDDDCDKLGHLLRDCGQFHEAARLLRRSLEANKAAPEPAHAEVAVRCSNLGLLLKAQGEFKQAEPLFRHALIILERAGADDFDVAVACSSLGQVLTSLGQLGEAETLLRRALAIHGRGPGRPELAFHLPGASLAQQLRLCYQLEQAENLVCRALLTSERLLGSRHPIVLIRCRNLGKLRTLRAKHEDVFTPRVQVMEDLARSLSRWQGIVRDAFNPCGDQ